MNSNFKKILSIFFLVFIAGFIFVGPIYAADETNNVGTGIPSQSNSTNTINTFGVSQGADNVYTPQYLPKELNINANSSPSDVINNLYKYALALTGLIAFGVIVYAAFMRIISGGDPGKAKASAGWIESASYGIILLFGAYILLNTINPNIVNLQRINNFLTPKEVPVMKDWLKQITVEQQAPSIYGQVIPGQLTHLGHPLGEYATQNNQSVIKSELEKIGVTSLPLCQDTTNEKGCVSFVGVQQQTIDEIQILREGLTAAGRTDININITSGTDGHRTSALKNSKHNLGQKFDISDGPTITDYIRNSGNFELITDEAKDWKTGLNNLEQYRDKKTGAVYTHEIAVPGRGSHWDIDAFPKDAATSNED